MNILVVSSGHAFSTLDVFRGLCTGLRSQGVFVVEYPLHDTLESMDLLVGAAKTLHIAPPGGYPDPALLASAGIPGLAMARGVEWVIVVHGENTPPTIPITLRRGGYKTALLCTESPYQTAQFEADRAQHYDVVFTTERSAAGLFGRPVCFLPHAYNPTVHTVEGPRAPASDVFLCGTRYPERARLLDAVDWTGIDLCDRTLHYGRDKRPEDVLAQVMDNAEVASYYRTARISLNHHRSSVDFKSGAQWSGAVQSLNPRAFEIPACGGFMVSDARDDVFTFFGDSVPTYTDADSLERVCRYFLTHADERARLAAAQRARVLAHSWSARAADLLSELARCTTEVSAWRQKPAPMQASILAPPMPA